MPLPLPGPPPPLSAARSSEGGDAESELSPAAAAAAALVAERQKRQDASVECPICYLHTTQVILCIIGHSCCPDCEPRVRRLGTGCPECRRPLLAKSPANLRILELLEFRKPCRNAGCPQLVLIASESPEQHEADCEFRKVACPNAAKGCPECVLVKDKEEHAVDCMFNEVTCSNAGCTAPPMLKRDLAAHLLADRNARRTYVAAERLRIAQMLAVEVARRRDALARLLA